MEKGKVNFTILCDKGEIARRLREAVKLGGGNSAVMAQSGIPSRTLGNYLSGRSEPKIGTLVRLSEACEVSLDWLATGEGPMRPMPRDPSDVVAGHIRSLGREHAVPAGMVGIPLLTEVAASAGGGAIVWHEDSIDFIHFNESWLRQTYRVNPANLSALPVTGESMEPTLSAKDVLLIDLSEAAIKPGDGIFVVRLEGNLLVKRLQCLPGGVIKVTSDNPAYEPYNVGPEDGVDFTIIGRVLLVLSVRHL